MTDQPRGDWFWEERTYRAANGRTVIERIPHGDAPEKFARFVANGEVVAHDQNTGQAVASRSFMVEVPGETIAEAMANVQDALKRKYPEQQKLLTDEIHKAMGPKLVGPGGQRLNGKH